MKLININKIYDDVCNGIPAEQPDYVFPGLVAATVGAIVAPGSTGKSYLAMILGLGVATRCELWHYFYSDKILTESGLVGDFTGEVVDFNLEDPPPIIKERLWYMLDAVKSQNVEQAEEYKNKFNIISGYGDNIGLIDDKNQINKDAVSQLSVLAKNKRLMIIDTLRRVHNGNENDSGAMSYLLNILESICRETGCTILYMHHCTKLATLTGNGDNAGASRGSSVLSDNARYQLNMMGVAAEEAEKLGLYASPIEAIRCKCPELYRGRFVRVTGAKVNYGAPGVNEYWYYRGKGGTLLRIPDPQTFVSDYNKYHGYKHNKDEVSSAPSTQQEVQNGRRQKPEWAKSKPFTIQ